MTDHTDLIARLEAATEGTRKLDVEIACAFRSAGAYRTYPAYVSRPYDLSALMGEMPEGWRLAKTEQYLSRWDVHLEGRASPWATSGRAKTYNLALAAALLRSKFSTPAPAPPDARQGDGTPRTPSG